MSNLFQYCPKFVIFDSEAKKVLLCQRKWEADFDNTYSFAWWKVENEDNGIRNWMQREKNEELGTWCKVRLYKELCTFEYYVKKDWTHMILPHHFCVFEWGNIELSDEYSGYKRFTIDEIESTENVISTVRPTVENMLKFKGLLSNLNSIIL